MTTPIHKPKASYHRIGAPIRDYKEKEINIYTDGSGGRSSSDKRLRRCGWAWVVPKPGSNRQALYGARGSMEGKQTVPRAELTALLTCLMDIKGHDTIRTIIIYSDCKMAVDGFHKGRAYSKLTACGAIWSDIWDCVDEIQRQGGTVELRKVKAHCEEEAIVPLPQQKGNQCADHFAGI